MSEDYEPARYWTDRLAGDYSLRGTGHLAYSAGYNRWIYRVKRRALKRGLRGIGPGASALDLGSGTGWVVEQLLDRGLRVEGCDIAANAVTQLRTRFQDSEFFQIRLGEEPFPRESNTYDVATALDVAYHMTDDEAWDRMVREVGRVLKPGGRFIASDRLDSDDVQVAEHVKFRSSGRWADAANEAGMKVSRVLPYYRWISRERQDSALARLSDDRRGAVEFVLEYVAPRKPHVRLVVLEKSRP